MPVYPLVEILTGKNEKHEGSLLAWGRHPRTGWWGLIDWRHAVREPGSYSRIVEVVAWVPAERLRKPTGEAAAQGWVTPRYQLGDNLLEWPDHPLPPRFDGTYLGVWADGPLPLPQGLEPVKPEQPERYLREP